VKVAITTDWLVSFGGAERVLIALHRLFPNAPVFTSVYDPRRLPAAMQGWDVRTSWLQRMPFAMRKHRALLPLMPAAFERFDFAEYDLVITCSSAFSKNAVVAPGAVNLCYCYSPPRYLWDLYEEHVKGRAFRPLLALVARRLRAQDSRAARRVDRFIAISQEVAGRIRRNYGRDSQVIYPPVDVERVVPDGKNPEDFYLVVSRLVPYKRIDLAIAAANKLRIRLVVVGEGPERRRLERLAGPTVEFLGRLGDAEIAELYARCRAFLFPGYEDFGIAPVEAQAAGRPVIAYGSGGATETVLNGETGLFFDQQTVSALADAILRERESQFDPHACRRNAERFSSERFLRDFSSLVETEMAAGSSRLGVGPLEGAAAQAG
jgi:glycosyltransferase involved in cell wall biosynthesis